jgi:hypothetical protein
VAVTVALRLALLRLALHVRGRSAGLSWTSRPTRRRGFAALGGHAPLCVGSASFEPPLVEAALRGA